MNKLLYGAGLVASVWVVKSLKNKDSALSVSLRNGAKKVSCFLDKYTEESKSLAKDEDSHTSSSGIPKSFGP